MDNKQYEESVERYKSRLDVFDALALAALEIGLSRSSATETKLERGQLVDRNIPEVASVCFGEIREGQCFRLPENGGIYVANTWGYSSLAVPIGDNAQPLKGQIALLPLLPTKAVEVIDNGTILKKYAVKTPTPSAAATAQPTG